MPENTNQQNQSVQTSNAAVPNQPIVNPAPQTSLPQINSRQDFAFNPGATAPVSSTPPFAQQSTPLNQVQPQQNIQGNQTDKIVQSSDINHQSQAAPTNTTSYAPQTTDQYLNPSNFQSVLGEKNVQHPPEVQKEVDFQRQIQNQTINSNLRTQIPQIQFTEDYTLKEPVPDYAAPKPLRVDESQRNETLKLVVYVIPIIGIFFLLLKVIPDKDFMWHVKQSLVAQAVWVMVIVILGLLNIPIISGIGLTLWKFGGYCILVYAGIMAYLHKKYEIPLAYDLGKGFIEEK